MSRFVTECSRPGLLLNEGKSVMQSCCAGILGGEFDGLLGVSMHAREKGFRMYNRTLALLSLPEVPQVSCQHWAGFFCFMAQFRRPVFSAVQDIFRLLLVSVKTNPSVALCLRRFLTKFFWDPFWRRWLSRTFGARSTAASQYRMRLKKQVRQPKPQCFFRI